MNIQIGMFDESNRLRDLSKLGDPLEKLDRAVDWGIFLPILTKVFDKERKGPGGRPPYPQILMFKILVLQRLYNISDDQTEYQIKDRMTFMRFLGLSISDRVPDAKTIWLFKENLSNADVGKELFDLFEQQLESKGLISRSGSIVDATFVEAPRQRNTRDENKRIKEGRIPEEWKKPENTHKLRQKDIDARWTKKGDIAHYGYKDEAMMDAESKLITDYVVVTANVHDVTNFGALIDPQKDRVIYGDSAFVSAAVEERVRNKLKDNANAPAIEFRITEKRYRGNPLTIEQKVANHEKSKIRCRVEHIFGFFATSMKGKNLRSIGIKRAKFWVGLTNLIYNMFRYEYLKRTKFVPVAIVA